MVSDAIGKRQKELSTSRRRCATPGGKGVVSSDNSPVNIGGITLSYFRNRQFRRWVNGRESAPCHGLYPLAIDEILRPIHVCPMPHPLTLPIVMPCMNCLCSTRKRTVDGMHKSVTAAIATAYPSSC